MKCTRFFCTWSLSLAFTLSISLSLRVLSLAEKPTQHTTILRQKNNNSIFMREQALGSLFSCVACLCTQCFAVGCFSIRVFKSLHGIYRRPEQHTATFLLCTVFTLDSFCCCFFFSWFVYFELMSSFCLLRVSRINMLPLFAF